MDVERPSMSNHTHETVPRQFVEAEGIRYAYRRFGKAGTVPLLSLEYFNSNMDGSDSAVTNSLAADHEVILFDNAGVGASGGAQTLGGMPGWTTEPNQRKRLCWKHSIRCSIGGTTTLPKYSGRPVIQAARTATSPIPNSVEVNAVSDANRIQGNCSQ